MSGRQCNKCKRNKDDRAFKSRSRKRCIECNVKQYQLNKKCNMMFNKATKLNLFTEYNALAGFFKDNIEAQTTDFQKGRMLLYRGICKMVEFDPERADMKEDMDLEERQYWLDLEKDIREGGRLLLQNPNIDRDLNWVLSFIPRTLHGDVDRMWHKLVKHDGSTWLC